MMTLEEYNTVNHTGEKSLQSLGAVLNRYCLTLTRSSIEAEDLAQETWAKALGYGKFPANPNPEALLLRIAKNTWIDAARRRASLSRALERGHSQAEPLTGGTISEIEVAFQALMKHQSPLQRTAFLMRDVLGYSAGETAEQLETTEGAVKSALHRARQALAAVREDLSADGGPAVPLDADYRQLLSALADAYEQGQIPVMLELLRQEHSAELTMAVSTGTVQALHFASSSRSTAGRSSSTHAGLRMAA